MTLNNKQNFEFGEAVFEYNPKKEYMVLKLGKESTKVKRTDLWMMVFMTNRGKRQDDLMEIKQKEMMQFVRQHQVRATKDIKAGEMITVNCNVNVPLVIVASVLKENGVDDISKVLKKADLSTVAPIVDKGV